jgi:L-lactate dehydrogenase complex protein LldF
MATYVSYVGGPRRPPQTDGPDAFHLVVLDNGRSRILADPRFREILCCIRCAACLNVCPVYGKIGGHAYGYAYCGPVGAVVTPLLVGVNRARHLCQGETLCGACRAACPVDIDLPRLLLELRALLADGDPLWSVARADPAEKIAFSLWSHLTGHRRLYDLALLAGRFLQRWLPAADGMIRRLPPPLDGWTLSRDMQPLAGKGFHERWRRRQALDPTGKEPHR